jgi:Fic family protein
MIAFVDWFNRSEPSWERIAVAAYRFLAIHPYEDGNGRLSRAIADMALSQQQGHSTRLFSFSATVLKHREHYYRQLDQASRGNGDLTELIGWHLSALAEAVSESLESVERVLAKSHFWNAARMFPLNERQKKVLNRMLDPVEVWQGFLNRRKYKAIAKCSEVSASRDLSDLAGYGLIVQNEAGGRSTSYSLNEALLRSVQVDANEAEDRGIGI